MSRTTRQLTGRPPWPGLDRGFHLLAKGGRRPSGHRVLCRRDGCRATRCHQAWQARGPAREDARGRAPTPTHPELCTARNNSPIAQTPGESNHDGGLTRRQALRRAGAGAAGLLLGLEGCGSQTGSGSSRAGAAAGPGRRLRWRFDMALDDPGRRATESSFKDPRKLAEYGYGGRVIGDWRPPTSAVTFATLHDDVFPPGSPELAWVNRTAAEIEAQTAALHEAGLLALYHTDMILLPTRLIERYGSQIRDPQGRISLERPQTQLLVRTSLSEAFERFPHLDGLLIRTGEVYVQDLPYHEGGDPITRGPASHLILLDILREEACVRRGKLILYRTWAFDGFTTSPDYYLAVTDNVRPHPLLGFSIKHTSGDFWRTVDFNPTLGIGRHSQVAEVECQREYEGKGAHPNYIAAGVIDGFEELAASPPPRGLADLVGRPVFAGILTWSRGGGWNGPQIPNELWCDLNAYVLSQWARHDGATEPALFGDYTARLGLHGAAAGRFRELAMRSAAGVLHGHYSTVVRLQGLAWTRDEYLGGSDLDLAPDFAAIADHGLAEPVLAEKANAVLTWQEIVRLADSLQPVDAATSSYLGLSSRYGALLYAIIANAWAVMLPGVEGDRSGRYDREAMRVHLQAYDEAWAAFEQLRAGQSPSPTLYVPLSFMGPSSPRSLPSADPDHGMRSSIERYRRIVGRARA